MRIAAAFGFAAYLCLAEAGLAAPAATLEAAPPAVARPADSTSRISAIDVEGCPPG